MALPLLAIAQGLLGVAPSIAKFFAGDKAEDAANEVIDIARQVTGINDPQGAVKAVSENPEYQHQYRMQLENNRARIEAMVIGDVQHAREQHKHSVMPAVIVSVLTAGILAFISALMLVDIPEANIRIIDTLFGSYLTAWLGSLAYWNGTTRGSAEKSRKV